MFVTEETLAKRLEYLEQQSYNVMSLDAGLQALQDKNLPDPAVVITFDDGYYTTYSKALPLLRKHGYPATLYLITNCFKSGRPLFNYFIGYLLWKAEIEDVDFSVLNIPDLRIVSSPGHSNSEELDEIRKKIVAFGEQLSAEDEREKLCIALATLLGYDYARFTEGRGLSLISADELREMEAAGFSIQMHTHLHRFPGLPRDEQTAGLDIAENIFELEQAAENRPRHFCYPYGRWSEDHWATLAQFGIETAATCDRGLVYRGYQPYALNRILDNEELSQIEFEAWMSGFAMFTQPLQRVMSNMYRFFGRTENGSEHFKST